VIWKKKGDNQSLRPKGIEERDKVVVKIKDWSRIDARVEEVGTDYAVLGLFREPDRPLANLRPASGTVEYNTEHGAYSIEVTVQQHNHERDAVRVTFDKGSKPLPRRQFFRVETAIDVVLSRSNGRQDNTYTLDLSAAGCLLAGPPDLAANESIRIRIEIGEGDVIRVRGRVVRTDADGHKAVVFDMIDEAVRDRLIRYLFERQRAERKVRGR
jgi:c-di-GMP-binding flagellar brake protein YcgR